MRGHEYKGDVLLIRLLDSHDGLLCSNMEQCIDDIMGLVRDDIARCALDMETRKYLNSSGLGELIRLKDVLLDRNLTLVLFNLSDRVRSLLDMVGVLDFFIIMNDETEL